MLLEYKFISKTLKARMEYNESKDCKCNEIRMRKLHDDKSNVTL